MAWRPPGRSRPRPAGCSLCPRGRGLSPLPAGKGPGHRVTRVHLSVSASSPPGPGQVPARWLEACGCLWGHRSPRAGVSMTRCDSGQVWPSLGSGHGECGDVRAAPRGQEEGPAHHPPFPPHPHPAVVTSSRPPPPTAGWETSPGARGCRAAGRVGGACVTPLSVTRLPRQAGKRSSSAPPGSFLGLRPLGPPVQGPGSQGGAGGSSPAPATARPPLPGQRRHLVASAPPRRGRAALPADQRPGGPRDHRWL